MTETIQASHRHAVDAPDDMARCPIAPTYGRVQVQFVRGEGSYLFDRFDKKYVDFLSGLAVTSLGHSHPAVAEAVAAQALRLQHVSNLFATEHNGAVSQAIDRAIGDGAQAGGQTFFSNSGAEANEAAIKLARKWGWPRTPHGALCVPELPRPHARHAARNRPAIEMGDFPAAA